MLKVKKQDITFGIRIVTYPRNGRTKDILPYTLDSVLNQTYKNWIIYLTGDDYHPNEEFESFASKIPKDKIKIRNIDIGTERKTLSGLKLWYCGGIKAINYTLDWMQQDGIKYLCILDDDDTWHSNHLESLYEIYNNMPEADFVYTRGVHTSLGYIPKETIVDTSYNNLVVTPCNVLHSATSWRLDRIPLRYINASDYNMCGDQYLWENMQKYFKENNLKFVYSPKNTLYHEEHKPLS